MKDLVGRFKSERFSGPAVEQAFSLCHGPRMDCSEVPAFGKEVSNQAIRVLVHAAFPRMIRRGKKDLRTQDIGGVSVSGELLPVVVGDGVDVVAQGV